MLKKMSYCIWSAAAVFTSALPVLKARDRKSDPATPTIKR